jgi:Asp-tRNA(Asn)/Glu-tRNA(Gln) amidotransferase A subunit family amidase
MLTASLWKQILPAALLGATLALFAEFLILMKERPVVVEDVPLNIAEFPVLGHEYNIVDLSAPNSAGSMLPLLSYIVTKSPLSPWILRYFLNKNDVHMIRELSAKHLRSLPPVHFPVHKATPEQMQQAQEWNDRFGATLYEKGHELSRRKPAPGYRSVLDYRNVYRRKRIKPSAVMERLIQGVEEHLAHLNMFASFRPDDIRKQALESDARWAAREPLSVWDGVPVAIKDMSPVAGHPLCFGSSECVEKFEDDHPAARLRAAGAIIVGTTVTTEGGVTPLGYAAFFDGPFNPYDTNYYSGGSSGGSAVAVASGVVPVAIGWDGGGSIRVPASMSGVEGLATTYGRIPYEQGSTSTNAKAGPLAPTMTDIALSYLLLSQPHPQSFTTNQIGGAYLPLPLLSDISTNDPGNFNLEGVRLGVFWDHFKHTDPEVYEKSLNVVRFLEGQGATIVNITIPYMREIQLSHGLKIVSEFGNMWEAKFYNETYLLEANTEITVMLGRTVTASEILSAEKIRHFAIQYVRKNLFEVLGLDAIVSPMLGDKVPKLPEGVRGYGESNLALVHKIMRFVPLANFLGLPGLTIPVGYEEDTGLPIGFQLMGDAWSEPTLIRLGAVVEQVHKRKTPPAGNYFDVLKPWLKS